MGSTRSLTSFSPGSEAPTQAPEVAAKMLGWQDKRAGGELAEAFLYPTLVAHLESLGLQGALPLPAARAVDKVYIKAREAALGGQSDRLGPTALRPPPGLGRLCPELAVLGPRALLTGLGCPLWLTEALRGRMGPIYISGMLGAELHLGLPLHGLAFPELHLALTHAGGCTSWLGSLDLRAPLTLENATQGWWPRLYGRCALNRSSFSTQAVLGWDSFAEHDLARLPFFARHKRKLQWTQRGRAGLGPLAGQARQSRASSEDLRCHIYRPAQTAIAAVQRDGRPAQRLLAGLYDLAWPGWAIAPRAVPGLGSWRALAPGGDELSYLRQDLVRTCQQGTVPAGGWPAQASRQGWSQNANRIGLLRQSVDCMALMLLVQSIEAQDRGLGHGLGPMGADLSLTSRAAFEVLEFDPESALGQAVYARLVPEASAWRRPPLRTVEGLRQGVQDVLSMVALAPAADHGARLVRRLASGDISAEAQRSGSELRLPLLNPQMDCDAAAGCFAQTAEIRSNGCVEAAAYASTREERRFQEDLQAAGRLVWQWSIERQATATPGTPGLAADAATHVLQVCCHLDAPTLNDLNAHLARPSAAARRAYFGEAESFSLPDATGAVPTWRDRGRSMRCALRLQRRDLADLALFAAPQYAHRWETAHLDVGTQARLGSLRAGLCAQVGAAPTAQHEAGAEHALVQLQRFFLASCTPEAAAEDACSRLLCLAVLAKVLQARAGLSNGPELTLDSDSELYIQPAVAAQQLRCLLAGAAPTLSSILPLLPDVAAEGLRARHGLVLLAADPLILHAAQKAAYSQGLKAACQDGQQAWGALELHLKERLRAASLRPTDRPALQAMQRALRSAHVLAQADVCGADDLARSLALLQKVKKAQRAAQRALDSLEIRDRQMRTGRGRPWTMPQALGAWVQPQWTGLPPRWAQAVVGRGFHLLRTLWRRCSARLVQLSGET